MIEQDLREGVSLERRWEPEATCPNCGGRGVSRFYGVREIPVHSVLLMPTRQEAVEYPRGDLELAFCPACGFVFNLAFDPSLHEYSPRYEETQGFSPTFRGFAWELAGTLIDKHDLRGRSVLEIGCGKGEFLLMLCERGAGRAIGIDPAVVPQRIRSEAADRVEFIQDFYGEKHAHLQADMVCCRHTLEHIAPTQAFMQRLRRTLGDRTETVVFFELPDVMRELEEGAFWDLYYEHCSYFSSGSLARLFRATAFDVTELELVYGGQYILITAQPASEPSRPRLSLEDDLAALSGAIDSFGAVCGRTLRRWHDFVMERAREGRRVVVWGSGSKGVAFLTTLGITDQIEYVVDINPHRQGRYMPGTGHEIVAPEFLADERPDSVIVMNPMYVDEIGRDLTRLGIDPELVAV